MSRSPRRYDPWIGAALVAFGLICGLILTAAHQATKP